MNNNISLTDELTGNIGIQTDHGGMHFGDLVVLLLDAVLLIYTAWRSYDFLSTTVPNGFEILGLVGLWGLDIGAVAWSLVWIFGSSTKYQDWTSMSFFIIDLGGVILTSVTDSLMYGSTDSNMTEMLTGVSTIAIPLVVVSNVVAGFIYHMTSPETIARRENRKAEAAHKVKMNEIAAMERDLIYAESYLLAKQDTLNKAVLLAEIKKSQDAVEKSTRNTLRDQVGLPKNEAQPQGFTTKLTDVSEIHGMDKPATIPVSQLKLDNPNAPSVPHAVVIPPLAMPSPRMESGLIYFTSKIDCVLNWITITAGDRLVAKKNGGQYEIGKPGEPFGFASISEDDFRIMREGPANAPEPVLVKGNGHHNTVPH